jgi:hypothetical protein
MAAALALTIAFAAVAVNGTVTPAWCAALFALFTLAFVIFLIPAVLLAPLTSWRADPYTRARHAHGWALGGLVSGLYFCRLEPAHQFFGYTAHLSAVGALDLVLLAAGAIAIWRACVLLRSVRRIALSAVLVAAVFQVAAWLEDPAGTREDAARQYPVAATPPDPAATAPQRVLFVGLDGLDWRVLSTLTRAGALPEFQRVIGAGDRWSLDITGLHRSPEIWSSLQTGTPPRLNGVGGFSTWVVFGGIASVSTRPWFGPHMPFLIDHVLSLLPPAVWDLRLTTSQNLAQPAFWEVAADAGRSVAVVAPYPFTSALLGVNGSMAVRNAEKRQWEIAETTAGVSRRSSVTDSDLVPTLSDDMDDLDVLHETRVAMAERLFRQRAFDVGVFYSARVDEVAHMAWRAGCTFFGECYEPQGDTPSVEIADVYRRMDRDLARLVRAFGPATVVIVSDHGWDRGEYAHMLAPDGVLAVSPSPQPKFRGRTNVYNLAPSLLEFLGLPPESNMARVDLAGKVLQPRADRAFPYPTLFVPASSPSSDRLELLRSVGYIAR